MQRLLLSYDCPECGTEFKQECIFAADSDEFRKIRAQLPRPFLTGENVCYKFHPRVARAASAPKSSLVL